MKGSLKERKKELSDYVSDFVFEEFYRYKFATVEDQMYSYYTGVNKVAEINDEMENYYDYRNYAGVNILFRELISVLTKV